MLVLSVVDSRLYCDVGITGRCYFCGCLSLSELSQEVWEGDSECCVVSLSRIPEQGAWDVLGAVATDGAP